MKSNTIKGRPISDFQDRNIGLLSDVKMLGFESLGGKAESYKGEFDETWHWKRNTWCFLCLRGGQLTVASLLARKGKPGHIR